jgi:branched-chain amino acid transport system substrate-binding protein
VSGFRAAAALAVGALALAACASSGSGIEPGETLKVYVSMPLRGAQATAGRDVVDGARMALGDADGRVGALRIRAVYVDDTAGAGERARWSPAAAAANARRASEDSAAIAYIGDFESGATRFSLPITNEAHILQVSPASAAVDLTQPFLGAGDQVPEEVQPTGERTFGRVIPSDEIQAHAGAVWAKRLHSTGVMVVSGDTRYDGVMATAFRDEAASINLPVTKSGPSDLTYAAVEPTERGPLREIGNAPRAIATDALLTPGAPRLVGPGAPRLLVTSAARVPERLPRSGQRFIREFRKRYNREPGPYAAYGYEAMAVILDSIARAGESGDDRDAVVDAFLETTDRESILGKYSIDEAGNTTLNRLSGYRVEGGRPAFTTPLTAPP